MTVVEMERPGLGVWVTLSLWSGAMVIPEDSITDCTEQKRGNQKNDPTALNWCEWEEGGLLSA